MVKFSCADFTFPVVDRLTALKLIKLLGFDYVDVGLFARSTHFSPGELQASSFGYTEKVKHDLTVAGLSASDVFLQIGVDPAECAANDPDVAVRLKNEEAFHRAVEFCVALRCMHVTGLPGVFHEGVSKERDLGIAAEVAEWRKSVCADAGLIYAIEPHVGSICGCVANTQKFLSQVDGLTLTLDYGHFVMNGEDSLQIHDLLPWASHVHVRGGAFDRLQTPVAENTIDFPGMFNGLKNLNYDGFLALEYVWVDWKGCNRTDNVSETILLRQALELAMQG